ncbi:MAG TPA: lipoprotein-releasing system transmembrane subunit LolC, partial [Telluria sp.]|nr:lipoprotein-releasing system transmembrane subunit LolC [Telluria sp.]
MSVFDQLPYEWTVGLRYTRAGKRSRRNSFISFISLISITCIALGVAALIIVMSVMNGFRAELAARIQGINAHVTIAPESG